MVWKQTKIHLFFSLSHTHTFPIANNSYHSFSGRHAFSSSQPHANSRVSTSRSFCTTSFDRDSIEYDVVIVDTGPTGLSATTQLKQMCCQRNLDLFVCVLEKRHDLATLSCFGRGIWLQDTYPKSDSKVSTLPQQYWLVEIW